MIRGKENKALAYKFSKNKTEKQAIDALLPALAAREYFIDKLNLSSQILKKAALISLVYNIGSGNFSKSSLLKELRGKRRPALIDIYFRMWGIKRTKCCRASINAEPVKAIYLYFNN